MDKHVWKIIALTLATILVSLSLIVGQTLKATAGDPSERLVAQITSVSQLEDVKQSDYYYEALRSLTETYGCFSANPDGTFRKDRPIVRAELVGSVQSCLDTMSESSAADREGTALQLKDVRRRLDAISAAVKQVQR
ncbi:MAG: hypothetical protein ACAF41_23925 [Leptolyngbya sp. BL-A-14]